MSSHVQVRGSIPIFWTQTPTFRYTPSVCISRTRNHIQAAKRHFSDLTLVTRALNLFCPFVVFVPVCLPLVPFSICARVWRQNKPVKRNALPPPTMLFTAGA